MHPLQNGTQVAQMPAPSTPSGTAGYMTEEGSPSVPGAHYFNAQIKEFENALAAAGVIFDPTRYDHLAQVLGAHHNAVKADLLKLEVGRPVFSLNPNAEAGLLDARGGTASRTVDHLLWEFAQKTGLVISQAQKNAEPRRYAMWFGDGDGSTSFALPNFYLSHFLRGAPAGVAHGTTQDDAIRPATGRLFFKSDYNSSASVVSEANGVFNKINTTSTDSSINDIGASVKKTDLVEFDLSRAMHTANEIRPHSGNIAMKIHRGWM